MHQQHAAHGRAGTQHLSAHEAREERRGRRSEERDTTRHATPWRRQDGDGRNADPERQRKSQTTTGEIEACHAAAFGSHGHHSCPRPNNSI